MNTINLIDPCHDSAIQACLMAFAAPGVDVTAIVIALLGMVGGWISWWLDRRRHKAEVKNLESQTKNIENQAKNLEAQFAGMKVDTERKYMEMITDMMERFGKLVVKPVEDDVEKLRKEVNELRDAIQKIKDCPYSGACPVWDQLQHKQKDGDD